MEELHRKQRLADLSETENQELARLEQHYKCVILVRSHCAWLLEQRGHDVRELIHGVGRSGHRSDSQPGSL